MKSVLISFVLCHSMGLLAQTAMLSNQGALLSIQDNAFVSVHGNTVNDQGGRFDNSGTLHLSGDWQNNVNNAAFVSSGVGLVRMQGDAQRINGTEPTRFFNLQLENTGVKYADIDVWVEGYLQLNDREFDVDTHCVVVYNTDTAAMRHTLGPLQWGFVSSLGNGGLQRYMLDSTDYFFPLGSNLGTPRFRPLIIRPQTTDTTAFKARMANTEAGIEGFDRTLKASNICSINPWYYHRIKQAIGQQPARVQVFYDANADGQYSDIVQWKISNNWGSTTAVDSSFNNLYALESNTMMFPYTGFYPPAFALSNNSPAIAITAAPNPSCADQALSVSLSSPGNSFNNYDYLVDGQIVASGTSNTAILNNLPQGQIPVWAIASIPECSATSDTVLLTVYPSVQATAYSDTIIIEGTAANLSASGGDFYNWLPDTALSCSICSTTQASPTQSTLYLVEVENMDGCSDTASVFVDVRVNLDKLLFVPNVLTPNNDGFNDTWFIKNIELFPKNAVRIINRWGDEVFSTNNYQNNWGGDYGKGRLPSGTYYYILDLGGPWGIIKGDVTIIRE